MEALRTAGIILGLAGILLISALRFGLKRLRNIDWLIGSGLSLILLLLGLFPDLFNAFLGFFSFEEGSGQRLIGARAGEAGVQEDPGSR